MRILIVGGHLTPALSVIESLPKDAEVIYVGRKHAMEGDNATSLEYETISKTGTTFVELQSGRLQRSFTRYTIPSLGKIPFGLANAFLILRKQKPDVVLSFGGYLSVPLVLAARTLKIPTVIHEQTLGAGAANKFLAKFADKICISFESSRKFFPEEKTVLTGNPIRHAILNPGKRLEVSKDLPLLYVTGGSQGSHFLNLMVSENLSSLLEKFILVHQVGASEEFRDFDKLSILKEGLNNAKRERYSLSKFYSPQETGAIMKAAALVVSRAGINTVSELIVLEKPALLVPIPRSSGNEQMENATFFEKLGLGEVAAQRDLTAETFKNKLLEMLKNIGKYKLNSSKSHFPKNAAEKIIEIVYASSKSSNKKR